ncbi:murein hydrolase activator EnvC family protein [Oharaeibacter diazotrophicus]|uniref:Septal ring factor EnvC (AmiA/AmiB activator) n=3 Tax=Oharaeibacter diazotrophicus TaxID=1920512 RepID=A0A4R6R7B0_9HYPH|nr:peptidoglycan DD-metalloendopeptidase family protein [Oharaeibacter diazotrophicus]TDP81860.1 septal ring factor EnvC (AmiA/AmiB activator) [Oharaeibacter diazotrophicus]BBE73492.1 murein hydrolase activator EnvC precursor [Pleomorphomonas sp. SM30]GLS75281.1 membrane protein [Oharaeibacter diazotrophicus]
MPPTRSRTPTAAALAAAAAVVAGCWAGCWAAGAARAEEPGATAYAPATVPDLAAGAGRDPAALEAERALKEAELDKVRGDLAVSSDRQAEIAAEIAALDKDQATLNDRLLAATARAGDLEQAIADSERRLVRHADNEKAIRVSLDGRRAVLIDVLAAAQRIGRRPPPALVVEPADALGAVRSAILLGAVLPEVRVEADALASDLAALVAVRRDAEAERDRLRADAKALGEEETRVTLLIAEKRKTAATRADDLAAEKVRAAELAAKAKSLEELMAAMERELGSVRGAAAAAAAAEAARRPAPGDAGRLAPAIAFTAAKGLLQLPVRGVAIQGFGDDNGLGGIAQGLSVATRAGARVVAPADGWVVYAGPFRSYGQLLILNVGDGYHVVLAGMERIDVELGRFVLTGEPVGAMGSRRLASATAPGASLSQPVLYIEFRKDGASIDPAPWWVASQDRKVRG